MAILKYKGKETYVDPFGRFFLETNDLVDLVEPEAAKLVSSNNNFVVATEKDIKVANGKS